MERKKEKEEGGGIKMRRMENSQWGFASSQNT